ncbi:Arginine metabolism regulation protein II [Meyerozyma sp. JA9]|nr:Arginine metabolism regulation protein II [Meyerozyma sp. JA9]
MRDDVTKPTSSSSESVDEASQPLTQPNGVKRSKTFVGCFTCRFRKVRCDLRRPACNNCLKAEVICAGYEIKLRWLEPAIYDTRGRKRNKSTADGPSKRVDVGVKGSDESTPDIFHRRHVGFVRWEGQDEDHRPYLSYDDMDRDLKILHNSVNDPMVHGKSKTKLLGPFGVFDGTKVSSAEPSTPAAEDQGKPRNKEVPAGELSSTVGSGAGSVANSVANSVVNSVADAVADAQNHDQLWLSNELRDDALLTAAALNGDSHFIDFITGMGQNDLSDLGNTNYNLSNDNEFLNLVFHRNHNAFPGTENAQLRSVHDVAGLDTEHASFMDQPEPHSNYSNYNNYFYSNPYQRNESLEIHLHASKGPEANDDESSSLDGDSINLTQMPASIMSIVQAPLQPKLTAALSIPDSSAGIPSTALQVQPLTRYLLNYYVTQVADLMTVIPLTENPWKMIYFPRALMAIGELSALGKTSDAKNALLNALLAVSAFNLQSKFPKNSESMKFYLNLGIRLRNQASLFVKNLLGSHSDSKVSIEHCVNNEKYKDVLCAVMSMISVDLVWGTMQDTNFYIKWCGRVISAKMLTKRKLSSKARVLHRIFSSLKLIQDSTCLDLQNIQDDFAQFSKSGYDINGDQYDSHNRKDKGTIDFIINSGDRNLRLAGGSEAKQNSPSFVNKKLINTMKKDENFATDALYGLPNSLIVLFSHVVSLVRSKIYYTESHKPVPDDLEEKVEKVDQRLCSWQVDWKLYTIEGDEKKFTSPMHEVTCHHIMSFYHALRIYFSRLVKGVKPAEIQEHVEKTLNHLNAIQSLIKQGEASIIPLFWQGFIAGCEALTPELQMGFKKWGADIAQYLGSYWGARQIMLEVWRRKNVKERRDDWVSVIKDWEMNLMLD